LHELKVAENFREIGTLSLLYASDITILGEAECTGL
jgi:hypothetical protein